MARASRRAALPMWRDVVRGIADLAGREEGFGQVFNMGTQDEVSINALAERVKQRTQSSSPIVHIPYDEAYVEGFEDMQRRVPDTSRDQRLDWVEARAGPGRGHRRRRPALPGDVVVTQTFHGEGLVEPASVTQREVAHESDTSSSH